MTPQAALRVLEKYVQDNDTYGMPDEELSKAFDTLWTLVLTGRREDS